MLGEELLGSQHPASLQHRDLFHAFFVVATLHPVRLILCANVLQYCHVANVFLANVFACLAVCVHARKDLVLKASNSRAQSRMEIC